MGIDKLEEAYMNHYVCTMCDYTYRPERGDITQDIPKGTAFEDLPEDWKCPMCKADKGFFKEIKK